MPSDRYYINALFEKDAELFLQDAEKHHLVNVMRVQVGEEVEVVNGKGQLAIATVKNIEKKFALLKVNRITSEKSPSFPTILCQAIPRLNRLDIIVEKGTELGMTELWLFPGEKGERAALTENQKQRLEGIAISAMKQCGRLDLPSISYKPSLENWDFSKLPYSGYFGTLSEESPKFMDVWKEEKGILFFIGPESGFSSLELSLLKNAGLQGVKLHSNILRTETASLVALSLISQK